MAGDALQAFGPPLARAGLKVLAPDAIGFESRRGQTASGDGIGAPGDGTQGSAAEWLQYYNHATHRLVRGELVIAKMLEDIELAISAVHGLTGVNEHAPGRGG